jgi:hypothetical protein
VKPKIQLVQDCGLVPICFWGATAKKHLFDAFNEVETFQPYCQTNPV